MQQTLALITTHHSQGMNETLRLLGILSANQTDGWHSLLNYPKGFSHLGFGNWVNRNDTEYKRKVLSYLRSLGLIGFSVNAMRSLYEILVSSELLGTTKTSLTDIKKQEACDEDIAYNSSPEEYNVSTGDRSTNVSGSDKQTSTTEVPRVVSRPGCGLLYYLKKFNQTLSSTGRTSANITFVLSRFLCTNETFSCFSLPTDVDVKYAMLQAIYEYIVLHLEVFIMHRSVISPNNDLVTTRSQRDFALGFSMDSLADDSGRTKPAIRGILDSYASESDARKLSKETVLKTCYDSAQIQANLQWAGKSTNITGALLLHLRHRTVCTNLTLTRFTFQKCASSRVN